ncbi:protein BRANCHLESS TRICHOME [Cynara cardunculus var. scolymus]|uniref:protein BRANCHLESS TRICHOME n=1 Tax=Cynara cardunculus var. scolymus TaxID=59895 RepID=UPI000D623BCB|nr:protein BRANCHLESS TRICHOME [Cynara cardunculus var. scolymus]
MMMINRRTSTFHEIKDNSFSTLIPTPTPTPTPSPTWKLYENPFYTCLQNHYNHNQETEEQDQDQDQAEDQKKQIHLLHFPVSTRKIAASFWDLTFIKPFMDSELDTARSQIMELRAQLDHERRARKKAESVNKKLTKELMAEKKERETLEKVCEELAAEITSNKTDMSRLKMDMEEERKMLRVAEVLREERVQMKLNDAKIMLEEKISELEISRMTHNNHNHHYQEESNRNVISGNSLKLEPENHHIKRGIRGFVEFPRVVRAIGSRSRNLGTKLECQKAQLMILLKQKTQLQSNSLIMS